MGFEPAPIVPPAKKARRRSNVLAASPVPPVVVSGFLARDSSRYAPDQSHIAVTGAVAAPYPAIEAVGNRSRVRPLTSAGPPDGSSSDRNEQISRGIR